VAATHWAEIEQEVNLCLINITNATLKIHQKLAAKTRNVAAESREMSIKEISTRRITHSLVAVRPLQPPPSVMSPTKSSRFKLLVPSAFSQPSSSLPPPIKQRPVSAAVVAVPVPQVAPVDQPASDGNVVSGFAASQEPVSFLLNGRQVGLWQGLLSAQTRLLSPEQLSEKERLFRTMPNIFIDFSSFKTAPSRSTNRDGMNPDPHESAVKEENMNVHGKLNLLRSLASRPSTPASRKFSGPSRSQPGSGEDYEPLSEENRDDGDVDWEDQLQFKLVMIVDTQRIMQVYLVKKLLELDMLADVCITFEEAAAAIAENSDAYSLIFIGCSSLTSYGVDAALDLLLPDHIDRAKYLIAVYEMQDDNDELLDQLAYHGVNDILMEPYTKSALKSLFDSYRARQEHRIRYSRPNTYRSFK